MKPPSKNISANLRGQSPGGRGGEAPSTSRLKTFAPSMTVPGEGGTEMAPGTGTAADRRQERSASHYAGPVGRVLGG